jgi:hypothetical protein
MRNTGKGGNLVGSIDIEPPSSIFTLAPGGGFNILPGGSQSETVTLVPTGTSNEAKALITSNDRVHGTLSMTVDGAGFAGRLSVPGTFSFRAPLGQETEEDLQLKNVGRGALSGNWDSLLDGPYSVAGGSFGPLQPQGTATIKIEFMPTAKGRSVAVPLIISIDAPATGGRSVMLRGIGE